MKTSRQWFSFEALLVAAAMTGCGYAKQADVDALRKELYATQDSISRLWNRTGEFVRLQTMADTIQTPPKCPPNCPKSESITSIMTAFRQPFPPAPQWSRLGQAH